MPPLPSPFAIWIDALCGKMGPTPHGDIALESIPGKMEFIEAEPRVFRTGLKCFSVAGVESPNRSTFFTLIRSAIERKRLVIGFEPASTKRPPCKSRNHDR